MLIIKNYYVLPLSVLHYINHHHLIIIYTKKGLIGRNNRFKNDSK